MPFSRRIGRTPRVTPSNADNARQLRVERALDDFAHLAKPTKDRLVPYPMRLYTSQIAELEKAARKLPGVTSSELAREIIEQRLAELR